MLIRYLIILTITLSAAAIWPVYALGDDVFVVPRVPVQAQADSSREAKSKAQAQGRRQAMDILLRRLTVEEDWVYLPRLATGQPAQVSVGDGAIDLDNMSLESLESGFEVFNEKSSSKTYRAYITYRFKPSSVRRLLRDARIPYSEAQTRTALVLPVLQTSSGLYLWEDNNPWMAAWKVRPYNNELTPMTAPLGDLEDTSTISASQALAFNQNGLRKLAERYSTSQVIIAHAYLQQDAGEDVLRVRLLNGITELSERETTDEIKTAFSSSSTSVSQSEKLFQEKVGDVLAESWFRRSSGNFPALAEEAIEVVIAKHAKPWKQQTLIDHGEASLIEASAYFKTISEWAQIRSALVSTPLIGSVQVRALSRTGADILVRAYGDPSKLVVAMEAQGLILWTDDGDVWKVAAPSLAQQIRSQETRDRKTNRFGSTDLGESFGIHNANVNPSQSNIDY